MNKVLTNSAELLQTQTGSVAEDLHDQVSLLLVDDDVRNLNALETILDSPDYHLVSVQSAHDALRALMVEEFALLILDVRMPETSGLELAHLIKQRKKTQHVPIMFLTAYDQDDEYVLRGYDVGAVDYLNKPFNPSVLRSKVAIFANLFRANRALRVEIAERKLAEERLEERTAEVQRLVHELRALASELTETEQRERRRLAGILHDSIQQLLVSARLQLAIAGRELKNNSAGPNLASVESMLKEALEVSRTLTVELSPPILHESGLAGGLRWLAISMAEKSHFSVELDCDPDAEPRTDRERFLLYECARELLFNSLKHSEVRNARVSLMRTVDGHTKMTVEDKGRGFDLRQSRDVTNRATFGLFSIQQRLAHLGGTIDIETAPGNGTRITLTTPVHEKPKGQDTGSVQNTEFVSFRPDQERVAIGVIIADDHKIMRECMANALADASDIEVLGEAEDGPSVVELAARLNPDVIIMDVNLGEMNGIEATRAILNRNPNIQVIGLSMNTDEGVERALRNAGAVAYLTKGDASEELILECVRSCVPNRTSSEAPATKL